MAGKRIAFAALEGNVRARLMGLGVAGIEPERLIVPVSRLGRLAEATMR